MIDEVKLTKNQAKGHQAEELLRNELLHEIIDGLKTEYINAWQRNTRVNDTNARERLWQAVQIVDLIKEQLKTIAVNGRIATKDLANIKYLKT